MASHNLELLLDERCVVASVAIFRTTIVIPTPTSNIKRISRIQNAIAVFLHLTLTGAGARDHQFLPRAVLPRGVWLKESLPLIDRVDLWHTWVRVRWVDASDGAQRGVPVARVDVRVVGAAAEFRR